MALSFFIQSSKPFIHRWQVPDELLAQYENEDWNTPPRKVYFAMLTAADEALGNATQAFADRGLWNDTLVVFMTDNGAATKYCVGEGEFKIVCDNSVSTLFDLTCIGSTVLPNIPYDLGIQLALTQWKEGCLGGRSERRRMAQH
jgi:arylsulfatase A-like enzyme